jgi:hypothetical protein
MPLSYFCLDPNFLCVCFFVLQAAHGLSLFLVDSDMPGYSRGRNLKKIGMKAQVRTIGQSLCSLSPFHKNFPQLKKGHERAIFRQRARAR